MPEPGRSSSSRRFVGGARSGIPRETLPKLFLRLSRDRLKTARSPFRFRDLSAASAMAVRSLGPPTTMSFRLAIGH